MYRANLHLYPHPGPHAKSSTVPGAFPSIAPSERNADFARTIQFTGERPTAQIGRSSRNESKGLFAAKDNGFFESPVMSRTHAEIKMLLHPTRKIIIKDTNSMHGTFVNGLVLKNDETAELLDGTELTFGADVTRGDEMFPAKTFRCGVHWEKIEPTASKSGYGVSSEDLLVSEYESEEEYDEAERHSDNSSSSGRSSSPEVIPISPPTIRKSEPWKQQEIPESHERSTKAMSLDNLNTVFESGSSSLRRYFKDLDEAVTKSDGEKSHPRVPSIPSLVHKNNDATPEKIVKIIDLDHDEADDDDLDEVRIVDRPSIFKHKPAKHAKGGMLQPICVDEDEPSDAEHSDDSGVSSLDMEVSERDITEDFDDDDDDSSDAGMDVEDAMSDNDDVGVEDADGEEEEEVEDCFVEEKPGEIQNSIQREPQDSQPELMNSKLSELAWAGCEARAAQASREAPSLPSIRQISADVATARTPSSAYHNWTPTAPPPTPRPTRTPLMDLKKEFFDARAENSAIVNERSRELSQWNLFLDGRPTALASWPPVSPIKLTEESMQPRVDMSSVSYANFTRNMKEPDNVAVSYPQGTQHVVPDELPGKQDQPEVETTYLNLSPTGVLPNAPSAEITSIEKQEEARATGKLSINDMMNAESPKVRIATPPPSSESSHHKSSAWASPPPSDRSSVGSEAKDRPLADEPTVSSCAPGNSRKRKHSRISHVEISATPEEMRADYPALEPIAQDESNRAPEVVDTDMLPELVVTHPDNSTHAIEELEAEQRPAKRQRKASGSKGGASLGTIAAATFTGIILGGAGMFAALVASAS